MRLAGVPEAPSSAPTRDSTTSDTQVVVDIAPVTDDNGSPITSYHVVIDDGDGGAFVEL